MLVSPRLAHTRAANIHTTHKGKNNNTDGARAKRAPHRYCCWRARSARPFVCGVNVGDLLCGTSIASIESIESIKSIESIESVESSDSIESIESILSIEPIESIEL